VELAGDLRDVGQRARLIVLAVPSGVARAMARELGDHVDGRHLVVHGVRGLAGEAMDTVSEIVRQETPARRLGALGGPVLADEVAAAKPSVMVCGSSYPEVNAAVLAAFSHKTLRVYATDDLRGLEWTSALVGCLAIGVGFAQELGLGPGLVAALITRAVHEAARVVEAAGGEADTMLGLGGYGDLLASIAQRERPEVLLGAALAQRRSLADAMKEAKLRVEAVELIPRVITWAEAARVRTPILRALAGGLFSGRSPDQLIEDLMTAPMDAGG